jgi:hypothetical protein
MAPAPSKPSKGESSGSRIWLAGLGAILVIQLLMVTLVMVA